MIYTRPNQPFDAILEGAPTSLAGTPSLGVRITRPATNSTIVPRTTTGIVETPTGSGVYVATLTAPLDDGDYLILWDTIYGGEPLDPDHTYTEDLAVTAQGDPQAITGLRPTLEDVGAMIATRTRTDGGGELGTFTADTRPTDAQVAEIITRAVTDVQTRVGLNPPDPVAPAFRNAAIYRAALLVELRYFQDMIVTGRSPYPQLLALYEEAVSAAATAAADVASGGQLGAGGVSLLPSGSFPIAPLIGERTIW